MSGDTPARQLAAILEHARATVDHWDECGRFQATAADKVLDDPRIGEPSDVAIARALLDMDRRLAGKKAGDE